MSKSTRVIASIYLVTCCSTVDSADIPSKITGQVVDSLGKPVSGVQVSVIRESGLSLDPTKADDADTLGSDVTDPMGQFVVRLDPSDRIRREVILITEHRDYLPKSVGVDKTSTSLVVNLTPRKAVEFLWHVRDEKNPDVAVTRAVNLLRGDAHSNWPDEWTADIYTHIGSIREELVRVATNGRWESPVKKGGHSPAYRARMLLAYWGDERDEILAQRWWNERPAQDGKPLLVDKLLPASNPAESFEEAIANWQTLTGIERGFTATLSQDSGRALVSMFVILPDESYTYHVVFIKRKDKWCPVFHREIQR